jgi:hypothetical protein
LAVLVAYAWWAVARPPFSASATAAVLLAGIIAAAAGVSLEGPRTRLAGGGRRVWVWLGLLAVGALWQLAAYLQHPRDEHPTLSSLANGLLDSQPARAAAFVLWLLATAALARR